MRMTILVLIALVIVGQALYSQNADKERSIKKKEMPKAILDAFQKTYPHATIKSFAKEKENGKTVYEVESADGTTNRDLIYNPDGSVVSIEETISFDVLPQPVRDALEKSYPKMRPEKCEKLTKGTVVHYEVVMKHGKKTMELLYDENGTLVKK